MSKKKKPNMFVLDCPICREPALPAVGREGRGYSMNHPNRIAPCFVKGDTDAAEIISKRFNEWFGTNDTTIGNQARTEQISDDRTYAEWSATYVGHIDSNKYERIKNFLFGQDFGIDIWEGEGGSYFASNPD